MSTINRLMLNICSENVSETKTFYTQLFDFEISYDSDWFVNLSSKDKQYELGIIDESHEVVPKHVVKSAQGMYLTIVVEKVDDVFAKAEQNNFEIIEKPTDTFYGQRRLLLKDPNGVVVDVSSPIVDFQPNN